MTLIKFTPDYPQRIVCLTEETTETLYLLGEGDRIVGVSGYTVRPPEARLKPKVSAFITAKLDKIYDLKPDLVIAFSDLQADIVRELIHNGIPVMTFNQRSVPEILQMILMVGSIIGCAEKAGRLVDEFRSALDAAAREAEALPCRPKVYFEEWMDPLISGIRWVEELMEVVGGEPVFPQLREQRLAKNRIIDPADVVAANPDLIIASWCGKRVNIEAIRQRPGWHQIEAVKHDRIHEIKSSYILQPGPAALTEGLTQLRGLISAAAKAIGVR
ncbi:MAG TPA: cobalamin-binding protein [Blastocatellia bacterium]|jgi:iron complex transport system substrate-binding protein